MNGRLEYPECEEWQDPVEYDAWSVWATVRELERTPASDLDNVRDILIETWATLSKILGKVQ
jgi:hypothetical protein